VLDLITFLLVAIATFFFTIEKSIYIAVGFAIIVVLIRIARPNWSVLVKERESGLWISEKEAAVDPTQSIPAPPGICVIRVEEGFIFPNSSFLNESVKRLVHQNNGSGNTRDYENLIWSDLSVDPTDKKVLNHLLIF
jgi:MFS superfamily sulfate permease-like transporter